MIFAVYTGAMGNGPEAVLVEAADESAAMDAAAAHLIGSLEHELEREFERDVTPAWWREDCENRLAKYRTRSGWRAEAITLPHVCEME